MLELARTQKARGTQPRLLVGDMMALPFRDEPFDVVTTGYGIRNVPVLPPAIAEIHRVLNPGGRLLSLDLNRLRTHWCGAPIWRTSPSSARRSVRRCTATPTLTATFRNQSGAIRGPSCGLRSS